MENKTKIVVAVVVFLVIVPAVVVSLYFSLKEGYDVTTVPDSTQILSSDANGNITSFPNLLNDLQNQLNALKTQITTSATTQVNTLTNQLNSLTTQVNNIVNGTTPLQNIRVKGSLVADSLRITAPTTTTVKI